MKLARWMLLPTLVLMLSAGSVFAAPIAPGTSFDFSESVAATRVAANTYVFDFDITDADITTVLPAGETLADTVPGNISIDALTLTLTGFGDVVQPPGGSWTATATPQTGTGTLVGLEPIEYNGTGSSDVLNVGLGDFAGTDPTNPNAVSDATGAGGLVVNWSYTPTGLASVTAVGPVSSTHIPISGQLLGSITGGLPAKLEMAFTAGISGTASTSTVIPEPGTLVLLGIGLLSLVGIQVGVRRRKRDVVA